MTLLIWSNSQDSVLSGRKAMLQMAECLTNGVELGKNTWKLEAKTTKLDSVETFRGKQWSPFIFSYRWSFLRCCWRGQTWWWRFSESDTNNTVNSWLSWNHKLREKIFHYVFFKIKCKNTYFLWNLGSLLEFIFGWLLLDSGISCGC